MFFSTIARNLSRNEILLVGLLLEKGAGRRSIVLRNSKLVTWSGLPFRTIEKVVTRLTYLRIVTRTPNGTNFHYKVSLAGARDLKRPTFPDRVSLTAQLPFPGFGSVPREVRLINRDRPLMLQDATLVDLIAVSEQFAAKEKSRRRRTGRIEQLSRLIDIVRKHDGIISGITVKEALLREASQA